tara:strand:- start:29 stop:235 length:207 start_codon:yes stop_codon:yes gene_type:complete
MTEKICKVIFYIVVGVVMATAVSNCRLDATTIEKCRTACNTTFSHMQEVTPRKCICAKDLESEWIIPR